MSSNLPHENCDGAPDGGHTGECKKQEELNMGFDTPIEDLEASREDWKDEANGITCARCGCATIAHFRKETPDYPDGICSKCNCPRWTTLRETKDSFIKVLRPIKFKESA